MSCPCPQDPVCNICYLSVNIHDVQNNYLDFLLINSKCNSWPELLIEKGKSICTHRNKREMMKLSFRLKGSVGLFCKHEKSKWFLSWIHTFWVWKKAKQKPKQIKPSSLCWVQVPRNWQEGPQVWPRGGKDRGCHGLYAACHKGPSEGQLLRHSWHLWKKIQKRA